MGVVEHERERGEVADVHNATGARRRASVELLLAAAPRDHRSVVRQRAIVLEHHISTDLGQGLRSVQPFNTGFPGARR